MVPNKSHGPLPQESSFVEAARASIPMGRVTIATSRGNLRGRVGGIRTTPAVVDGGDQANRGEAKVEVQQGKERWIKQVHQEQHK